MELVAEVFEDLVNVHGWNGILAVGLADGVEADLSFLLAFAGFVFGEELFDGLEDGGELFVVFLFEGVDFAGEVSVVVHEFAELDEGSHDGEVDFDGEMASQDAGKHGNALLGEGKGRGAAEGSFCVVSHFVIP